MAYNGWQATVQDDAGNAIPLAEITVRKGGPSGDLATIYSARTGTAATNPFFASVTGLAQFFASPGVYYLTASLDGQTTDGWYVSITSSLTDGFATRAAFIAALGWPWESGAVVSDGTVQYEYLGTGTVIADMPGWVPFEKATPNHWAENTTPGTTNLASAIQAAGNWCQASGETLHFLDQDYRFNTTLSFTTGGHAWVSDRAGNQGIRLQFGGATSARMAEFGPTDPLLSTTAVLSNFTMKGIVFQRLAMGATAEGVVFTKCQNIQIYETVSWGNWRNWSFIGCRNLYTQRLGGSAAGLFSSGAGSANIHIGSFDHTDTSAPWLNYTHIFTDCLISGYEYDATFLIEDADYTVIQNGYFGSSKARVLVRPATAASRVVNVEINGSYQDGGSWPGATVGEAHLKIDNAAGGKVAFVRLNGGIIAQCEYGILIENPEGVETVTCHGVDFHNSLYNFVRSIGTSATLDLRIMGGNMTYAARTAAATGDDEYAVCVDSFKSVAINGVVARTYASETQPLFKFGSGTDLQLIGNTASGVTVPVTITGSVTRRIERGNACNVSWADFDDTDFATSNPTLKFGGVELVAGGGAYTSRVGDYFRHGNHVTVRGSITLSSKTGAAGALAITLPIAALSSSIPTVGAVWVQGMTADALAPSYVLILPAGGGTELQIRKMTTTGAPSGQIITDAAFGATATITYTITYRVA